jgi:predicted RNase H-like HicB family nuclease
MQLTVEFGREADGRYLAEVLELRGCLAYGRTRSEADALVRALALRIVADEIESGRLGTQDVSELLFEENPSRGRSCGVAHIPNAKTVAAMREAVSGRLPSARNVRSMFAELDAED